MSQRRIILEYKLKNIQLYFVIKLHKTTKITLAFNKILIIMLVLFHQGVQDE